MRARDIGLPITGKPLRPMKETSIDSNHSKTENSKHATINSMISSCKFFACGEVCKLLHP